MALPRICKRIAAFARALRDPAAWSAARYRASSAMHFAALRPGAWRRR